MASAAKNAIHEVCVTPSYGNKVRPVRDQTTEVDRPVSRKRRAPSVRPRAGGFICSQLEPLPTSWIDRLIRVGRHNELLISIGNIKSSWNGDDAIASGSPAPLTLSTSSRFRREIPS